MKLNLKKPKLVLKKPVLKLKKENTPRVNTFQVASGKSKRRV